MVLDTLEEAKKAGVRLYLKDGKLKAAVKNGQLPDQLKEMIALCKQEIMSYLAQSCDVYHRPPKSEGFFPLSYGQNRIWLEQNLAIDQPHYNMQAHDYLLGDMNVEAFRNAVTMLLQRHEVLRSTYHLVEGEPVQRVETQYQCPVNFVDLSGLAEQEKMGKLNDLVKNSAQQVVDLERDLMLKVDVLSLSAKEHLVVYTMHHIASDAWSVEILRKELNQLYRNQRQGLAIDLPKLSIQYKDFAKWQKKWLTGSTLGKALIYWSDLLQGAPQSHSIALDKPRPSQASHVGCVVERALEDKWAFALEEACKTSHTTSFVLLQTVFSLLLGKYSGQNDIVMGVPISGRTRKELEPLIGFFINTLPMRIRWSAQDSFSSLLAQNKASFYEAYDHQAVPLDTLVEQICTQRVAGQHPLFQVAFQVLKGEKASADKKAEKARIKRASAEHVQAQQKVSIKVDLELHVSHSAKGVNFHWVYSEALFEHKRIERMADNFMTLLKHVIGALNEHKELPINQLQMLSPIEKERLLRRLNGEQREFPSETQLHRLIEHQAYINPNNIAVECGEKTITYEQLNGKANQLAQLLIENGVGADVLVGVAHHKSCQLVVSMLAVLKAGGAYLPIDPSYPDERIKYMVKDSGIKLIITDSKVCEKLHGGGASLLITDDDMVVARTAKNGLKNIDLNLHRCASNLIYVIYTSGSTGQPKGVMIEHSGIVNYCMEEQEYLSIDPASKLLHVLSISFDAGNGLLFSGLISGAHVVFKEPSNTLSEFMKQQSITHAVMTSSLLNVQQQIALPELKVIATGAETINEKVMQFWQQGREFWNLYGPTEASVAALRHCMNEQSRGNIIGRPLNNVTCYVVDEHMKIVPQGVVGELCIGGVGVARGYLHKPQLTQEKFVKLIKDDNEVERVYRTGDLVRCQEDGTFAFVGRKDSQVKIRGYRVELEEIERFLLRISNIDEAVIKVHEQRILAYVVTSQSDYDENLIAGNIRRNASKALPKYMVPDTVYVLEKLPLTPNGKVDKHRLPTYLSTCESTYIAPRNDLESKLQQIWQDLLGRDNISINDDFFDIGGHSLLAMKLINQINVQLSEDLSLRDIFDASSIEKLANTLSSQRQSGNGCLVSFTNGASLPPIFFALGLGMFSLHARALANELKSSFDLHVFETPSMMDDQAPIKDLNELLDLYEQAVVSKQPEGEVQLMGHSFGGSLMYQLAVRLEAQGRAVSLILLDSFFSIFEDNLGCFCSKKLFSSVYSHLNDTANSEEDTVLTKQHLNNFRSVVDSQYHMLKAFMPEVKLKGSLSLFFAKQGVMSDPSKFEQVLDTYNALFDTRVEYIAIEGDHLSVLDTKNSESLSCRIIETFSAVDKMAQYNN